MQSLLRTAFVTCLLGMGVASSHAAFVNFVEAANEIDPVAVATDLLAHPGDVLISGVTAERAVVSGYHTPGISPAPVPVGKYAAVLFEPGDPQMVSDVVLVSALAPATDPVIGLYQDLVVGFLSADILLSDLLQTLSRDGYAFLGGKVEDGTLQDVMVFDGALTVRVLSDAGPIEVPEPGALLLLAAALLSLALARHRPRTRR